MANSVNPDQTARSEGVLSGSTLFAQRLESIKTPVCNIYVFFPPDGWRGGVCVCGGRGGGGIQSFGIGHPTHTQPVGIQQKILIHGRDIRHLKGKF